MDLKDKNIFVTGGSRGIGAAIVEEVAAQGARVFFTYSSNEQLAHQLIARLPGKGHKAFSMNLQDLTSIETAFEAASEVGLHGVVNNAGMKADQLLLRLKAEDFETVLKANLTGNFWVTKLAVKHMLKRQAGSVVNLTSVVGQTGNPGQSNYAASKAGLEAFTKSVAQEVASRNIRLNCVAPGFIETDMTQSLPEAVKAELLKKIPMQRIAAPKEVAHAVCFLLSDKSSYITGHSLNVNGGMYMI